jgi:hypothetical protein
MKTWNAIAAVTLATGIAGFSTQLTASALKCPRTEPVLFPKAPDIVTVLDGKPVSQESVHLEHADLRSIVLSIEIKCAAEIHRRFGIESQRGGVVIVTRPGAEAALKASLESIDALQKAYFEKNGTFASKPSDLGWNDATEYISIAITLSDGGKRWSAQGAHSLLTGISSTISGSR